ncbi:MAG: amidohydrolase family protein [Silicimonas sp.]
MIIDYASSPPLPAFRPKQRGHLTNYDRVYANSQQGIGPQGNKHDLEDYLSQCAAAGLDRVILHARDVETTFGLKVSNEDVAAFCRDHGPRFLGFAGVDPHKGVHAVDELDHAVRELGLLGLNIQCFESRLPLNDPKLYPLFEKCIALNIPVNLHVGMNFSLDSLIEYGRPLLLDRVLADFPDLKIIAAPPGWPWVQELIAVAWRHRNLYIGMVAVRPKYLAVAESGYGPLLQYGKSLLQNQIIFGSAYPLQPVARAYEEVRALGLTGDVVAKWLGGNLSTLLKIDDV